MKRKTTTRLFRRVTKRYTELLNTYPGLRGFKTLVDSGALALKEDEWLQFLTEKKAHWLGEKLLVRELRPFLQWCDANGHGIRDGTDVVFSLWKYRQGIAWHGKERPESALYRNYDAEPLVSVYVNGQRAYHIRATEKMSAERVVRLAIKTGKFELKRTKAVYVKGKGVKLRIPQTLRQWKAWGKKKK